MIEHSPSSSVQDAGWPVLPQAPRSVQETGLELSLLCELCAKALYVCGKAHLPVLATRLRLPVSVLREVLDYLVAEQMAEIAWRGESDIDVQYQLTGPGRQRAAAWLERSAYTGPAPVPLDVYRAIAQRQAAALPRVSAQDIADAFADDCTPPQARELIGAALHSGRALFLHGPSGSGKSTLARKLGGLLQGVIGVPHALAVGPEIVRLYDPAVHHAPALLQQSRHGNGRNTDARWALCQRPVVQLGAELTQPMLDLRRDALHGCHQAPPHLKANHGLLIVDDLGRQRVAADELLARFAKPLEQQQDVLSLQGASEFAVPFHAVLALVTSQEPELLLDSGALRRVGYKLHVGPLPDAAYRLLFRQQCRAAGVEADEGALAYLVEELHHGGGQPLLACFPREILSRIVDFAAYAGRQPHVSVAAMDQAWSSMFAAAPPQLSSGSETSLFARIE
jgi:energy-coupling factor transporter ATP-binding protein EcfA2